MKSDDLISRDKSVIWHPFTQSAIEQEMLDIDRASGASLFLTSGEELIDGISSWWCNLHGHGHPDLVKAATNQFKRLDHVLFAGCTHEPAVALGEELVRVLPGNLSKVFYSDNGSTAVEVALKMAIQWWHNRGDERSTVVALTGSYHGDTFGAMSAGARGLFTKPFDQMLFQVEHLEIDQSEQAIDSLERLCATGQVAAFIYEPLIQGAGGMRIYSRDTLERLLDICKSYGVICIADEVMTGFGRTGPLFASSSLKTPPDIICISKGLTSGSVPLSATVCSEEIFQGFVSREMAHTFFHGHTYTGNPIAASIALASLKLTESDECASNRARIHAAHVKCAEELSALPTVSNARVLGTILAFDLLDPEGKGYLSSVRDDASRFFRSRGVLLRPLGNVVYALPPYCITDEQLERLHRSMIDFASGGGLGARLTTI
jgi:adenosylmethionine-8-amino-7-oxononanoate aminotransferase